MSRFYITALSDVSCPIPIFPDWTFHGGKISIDSSHRTQDGTSFLYRWGFFRRYSMRLSFVNSSERNRMAEWWENQEELAFTFDSSLTESTIICRIVNDAQPMTEYIEPYDDLFQGEVRLESRDNAAPTRRPFILDDAHNGLLDQNYNALLR